MLKIAIWSRRNAYFCFQRFVLCQWCQSDASKTSKTPLCFSIFRQQGWQDVSGRAASWTAFSFRSSKIRGLDNILPQNRHMDESRVVTSTISVARSRWLGLLGGYWMSWRLAYDSPPIDNRQPTTTNQQPTHKRTQERQPTTNSQPTNQPTTN